MKQLYRIRKCLAGVTLLLIGGLGFDLQAEEIRLLWPNDSKLNDPDSMGREVEKRGKLRMQGVDTPHIRLFPAPTSDQPTPAIIHVPGGGYKTVVTGIHTPIADWFTEQGVRPFMLIYRCPADRNKDGTLADIQRAIRMLRANAEQWNIDPDRIGVIGSSAGGHLSVRASTQFDYESYKPSDPMDRLSPKPNFAILLYPAFLASRRTGEINDWVEIPDGVPPTVLFAARDDKHFGSSPAYEKELKEAGATVESLYFESGGHGFSLREPEETSSWPEACEYWLREIGVLR